MFSTDFRKILKVQNFFKIFSMAAELFHADGGQTDMTKLIVALCNFVNASKNESTTHNGTALVLHLSYKKKSSHLIPDLSRCLTTQPPPKLKHFSYCGSRFSIPCWYQSVSCVVMLSCCHVVSYHVTTVSTSLSFLNFQPAVKTEDNCLDEFS